MRQTTGRQSYVGSRAVVLRHVLAPSFRGTRYRRGFTLIELVVAMAILLVVVVGVLSSVAYAYTGSTETEMRNTAKNIGAYSLEYLRARTVTTTDSTHPGSGLASMLGISSSSAGTYGWYNSTSNVYGAFPSMADAGNLPVQSDGHPCSFTAAYVKANNIKDGDPNQSGGTTIRFSSKHAALPSHTYGTTPLAWTTALQGYVSVTDADAHGLLVRYPGVPPSTQPVIASFTAGPTYVGKVWATDADKVDPTKQAYNSYYTRGLDGTTQSQTHDYRGFRVLTQIVARSGVVALDGNGLRHVQYYDVTVTVLWMNGTHESNYELSSRILVH